jgi:membrane associated rhomboid family serine protease
MALITYLLIGTTVLASLSAWNNPEAFFKLKHYPYQEARNGEYYRWLTGGFLHGDQMHLFFNMLTLYFFGPRLEQWFQFLFPKFGQVLFLLFYLLGIVAASSATYSKHKDNPGFASIGASGAVAAVLFAAILLEPTMRIGFIFLPIFIPGFIFGILYLWYSSYAADKGRDNIDHVAHFFGAVFGFMFPLVLKPSLFSSFLIQLQHWFANLF